MPALSMESFEWACANIMTSFSIPQAASKEENLKGLMKQYLGLGQTKRWLLVVDNVDNPAIVSGNQQSQGIVDYLPESDQEVVIYTARRPEMAELTRDDALEIEATGRQDATDFLTKSLVRKDLLQDDATMAELFHEIPEELTCLPLQ
jgi:hypothetical protein